MLSCSGLICATSPRELETRQGNLVRVIEATAEVPDVLLARLTAVSAELQQMQGKRADLVVPEVELPEDLPELYRAMVADLAAALSDEPVAGRAADELHEFVERVVVHWDEDARGHWLSIEGSLLEMLRKSAPRELDAVRGDIFAEVGCGSRMPTMVADRCLIYFASNRKDVMLKSGLRRTNATA